MELQQALVEAVFYALVVIPPMVLYMVVRELTARRERDGQEQRQEPAGWQRRLVMWQEQQEWERLEEEMPFPSAPEDW